MISPDNHAGRERSKDVISQTNKSNLDIIISCLDSVRLSGSISVAQRSASVHRLTVQSFLTY